MNEKIRMNILIDSNNFKSIEDLSKNERFRGIKFSKGEIIDIAISHFLNTIKSEGKFDELSMQHLNMMK